MSFPQLAPPNPNWDYRAKLLTLTDGDTARFEVDCGFGIFARIKVRFLVVDTPEVVGVEKPLGLAAKEFVQAWFDAAPDMEWPLILRTEIDKTDKYGRWLAYIWRDGDPVTVQQAIIEAGHDEGTQ